MRIKKRSDGFTLIELLVVIAVIALLLAILIPSLRKAKAYAHRVICAGRFNQIGVAMKLYADTYKESLPTNYRLDIYGNKEFEMHGYVAYRKDWTTASTTASATVSVGYYPLRLACLYETGLMDMPEIFYCPGNFAELWKYESYTDPEPWGSFDQVFNTKNSSNQWVRVGLTYYPVARNPKLVAAGYPDPAKAVAKYTDLNMNMPYITDVLHTLKNVSHQSNARYADNGTVISYGHYAVNALFGDGHVSACIDQGVFKDSIWDSFGDGTASSYDRCYYTIFKLIGPK